ncbi:MAG: MDR family MFS transporter [Acidimicrobiia bacterium]
MPNSLKSRIAPEWAVAIVYVGGLFVTILDTMIVNVALPTLSREFEVGTSSIEWIVTGYLLSLAVWIPASGWIGDRFGTKRIYLLALGFFTVASGLCGLATSLPMLVGFRVLQGVGGGMLTPVGMAMLWRAFPPERRAQASRILIVPTAVAPASGPIIGGLLVEHASWRWCFLVNVPIGIAAIIFGAIMLEEHREPREGSLDVAGFVLSGLGLASLLYGLAEGPVKGWRSTEVLLSGGIGVAALTALVIVELRLKYPMLRFRLLQDRMFRSTNLASFALTSGFLGVMFVLPLYIQNVQGHSPLQSGLTTFPEAIGVLASSQFVGRLYPRIGPRRMIAGGLVGMAVGMTVMSRLLEFDTSPWTIRIIMFLLGICLATCLIPLQAAAFSTIPPARTGDASAIVNAMRQTSSAVGVAVLATVLSSLISESGPPNESVHAFRVALLVAAGIALFGSLIALMIRDTDAAATMTAKGHDTGGELAEALV